ncbi:MAG: hexitol phosphatase HxpB [candidate division Zixibacteria bacterium]|nr:hexitol phosphatase HxpB [candidate division Zixibacteria bacterium]
MIEAVIFDMDGILIDSEPIWHAAEMAIFPEVGIHVTKEDCLGTQGLRVDEVVDYWYRRHPWPTPSKTVIADRIVETVIAGVKTHGKPIEGINPAIDFFRTLNLKIALASSSAYALIDTVIDRFDLRSAFEIVYSAQEEPLGKPHPGVYLTTARRLGVAPDRCLAIEDSINGVIAAKAARMQCIAIPEATARFDRRYGVADSIADSLSQIGPAIWTALPANITGKIRS